MVVPIGADERADVCTASGLNIVTSVGQRIYRVAKTSYGALNPPKRAAGSDPSEWSRWDTPGRTIYGGSTATGAFVEVLEYITPDPPATPLSELFDDVDHDDAATLAAQIARELPGHGAMAYRSIPKGWRTERTLYELELPADGWFVDVTGADSISVIDRELQPLLVQCGIGQLTMSELTATSDEMKRLTAGIATWVRREVVLHDGSIPHGIVYPSKWGRTMQNWAMWMRRTDDGTGPEPVRIVEASDIGQHTRGFPEAARLRQMRIH
ncbi:RES domain-containing protein [Mycobacteroides chelonae]|uniref:RES domain-containing protein n=1 Tax=Mycobacteroides chelonae TaxID=1774 RepID=UPI0018EF7E56|nr:RES domain-containing protein [Mycobacteroides chelonae]